MTEEGRIAIDARDTIKRRKVSDEVRDAILAMIRDRELNEGDRLAPERDLANQFGVSRTTLRDAIRELELLGYLDVRQGDGTVVRNPGGEALATPFRRLLRGQPQLAEDLLQFRRILEPEVAALAALRCTESDAAELRTALERQRKLVDTGRRLLGEDLGFHRLIARVAGNTTVLHVLNTLQSMLLDLRSRMLTGDQPVLALEQHTAIATAIIDGDPAAARSAVHEHLEAVERSIVRDQGTSPREVPEP
jgi:GntR family transcriptional repressor for pyruvate dehydrogenase complex